MYREGSKNGNYMSNIKDTLGLFCEEIKTTQVYYDFWKQNIAFSFLNLLSENKKEDTNIYTFTEQELQKIYFFLWIFAEESKKQVLCRNIHLHYHFVISPHNKYEIRNFFISKNSLLKVFICPPLHYHNSNGDFSGNNI